MKAFTLILMAALCGTAAADPDRRVPYDHPYDHHADNDRRGWEWNHHRDGEWTQLMSSTPANGVEYANIQGEGGRISQLRVVADSGRVYVRNVMVQYRDGSRRFYRVDRWVRENGDRTATVQLDRDARIARIAVSTARGPNGTFSVYGA